MAVKAVLQPTPPSVGVAIERIVKAVRPSRIIAFGSRAHGKHRRDSDVDLFVILSGRSDRADVSSDLYEVVGAVGFSKDILISNEEDFARLSASPNSVQGEAARDGVTLYENGRTDRAAIEKICR